MNDSGISTYKRLNKAKVACELYRKSKFSIDLVAAVVNFYQDDSNSRLGEGMKNS